MVAGCRGRSGSRTDLFSFGAVLYEMVTGVLPLETRTKAKIALLNEQMDAIHYANELYWKRAAFQTHAAKADYQFRKERLEEIRALAGFRKPTLNSTKP